MQERFGDIFKRYRIESGQTLRTFCAAHGFDAGNISKVERGRMPPPESEDILNAYSKALGLKPQSPEWNHFRDTAAAGRGDIPQDLLDDAQLVDKLPVLFRVLREAKRDGDALDKLVEKIRRA